MKMMKKLFAIALVAAMVMALCVNAAAANDKHITLTNPSAGHTYTLYQVFTGSFQVVDGKDTLGDIAWGSGVTDTGKTTLGTAADVAKGIDNTEAGARAFADSLNAYLTNGVEKSAAAESPAALTWDGLSEGYYIIKDTTTNLPEGDTADLVVVQVLDNVEIAAKSGTVIFDKQVADRNDSTMKPTVYDAWGNTSDYDVGDDVPYQVTITLPANFSSYETYTMTVKDKMDAGLSFNNDVMVKIGDTVVDSSKYAVKTTGIGTGETFNIVFGDVKSIDGAGDNVTFTITYSAKLTGDNVVYGNPGNKNEAWLTYSNNPVTGQEGGVTPHKTTVTFTYKFEVDKVDASSNPLPGAEFALEKQVMKEDGKTEWATLALIKNDAGTVFTFDGLDDGQYRITETVTPAGYNSIDPIYFSVVATHSDSLTELVVKQTNEAGTVLDTDKATATFSAILTKTAEGANDAGLIQTNVVNQQGAELPSTGGIGTKIFYGVGAVLVIGAGVVLMGRKRAAD